ncbi:MAG: septum formation initiator family protein [Vicinamibacterales bacterium]
MTPPASDPAATLTALARRIGKRALPALVTLVAAAVVVDAVVGDKGLMAMLKARRQYRALEQALTQATTENARLREEARRLREDPAAIEEIARRELGLIRPGEKLFIIRDVPGPSAQ